MKCNHGHSRARAREVHWAKVPIVGYVCELVKCVFQTGNLDSQFSPLGLVYDSQTEPTWTRLVEGWLASEEKRDQEKFSTSAFPFSAIEVLKFVRIFPSFVVD